MVPSHPLVTDTVILNANLWHLQHYFELEAEPILEDKSPFDSKVPESGIGWKYQFSKWIALAPGKHKLTIALPVNDVIVERGVELRSGVNAITATPVYSKRMLRPYKGQNFTAGVKTIEVQVN